MDDLCKCGHEMIDHRDPLGCEDCLCDGFRWPTPAPWPSEHPDDYEERLHD